MRGGSVEYVWDYGLFSTGEAENLRLITVGKVVNVLVLFLVGLVSVAAVLGVLRPSRCCRRFRLSKDATAVIRTIMFYVLLVSITLAALHKMNVPLTAFTILGGALAIGVGFGSQALINNFISGLIMLAERPVRIGERVLFGNYDGVIEDVGFRCTKLRTGADHLVTIPNSALVNDSIENVGRRRTIQRTLNLQITYDTPRETVAAAVAAIRGMLEEPGIREPIHPVIGWEKHPPEGVLQRLQRGQPQFAGGVPLRPAGPGGVQRARAESELPDLRGVRTAGRGVRVSVADGLSGGRAGCDKLRRALRRTRRERDAARQARRLTCATAACLLAYGALAVGLHIGSCRSGEPNLATGRSWPARSTTGTRLRSELGDLIKLGDSDAALRRGSLHRPLDDDRADASRRLATRGSKWISIGRGNRPSMLRPEDCWGLDVWKSPPPRRGGRAVAGRI